MMLSFTRNCILPTSTHLLGRNIRYEEDLVDQLLTRTRPNASMLLAHFGKEVVEAVGSKISQDSLREMVG